MDFLNFRTSDEKIKKMFQNKEFLRFFLECEGERKKMEENKKKKQEEKKNKEKIINFMNMKTLLMKRVRIMQLQNPD